jgi:hypothetical protein
MHVSEAHLLEAHPVGDFIWEIPTAAKEGMLVPARIYALAAFRADTGIDISRKVVTFSPIGNIKG